MATTATIATDKGDIVIELKPDDAPKAAGNFVKLATQGFFDGVVFHRVIPGFVIQGGDGEFGRLEANGSLHNRGRVGTGGPGYKFADEPFTGDYQRGAVAMANAGPNTNGSQFFICQGDLRGKLPRNYTIFGTVLSGMDVVDQIANGKRDGHDFPNEPVAMRSVTMSEG